MARSGGSTLTNPVEVGRGRRAGVALAAGVMGLGLLAACGSASSSSSTTAAPTGKVLLVGRSTDMPADSRRSNRR
jgi:hypothetical protein